MTTPTHQTKHSAGADVYAAETKRIYPGQTVLVKTGAYTPQEHRESDLVYMLMIRSSIALKRGLGLLNSVGVIDADYPGEIMAMVHNFSDDSQTILEGERIAQLVALKYETVFPVIEEERTGGFGSTK